MEQERFINNSSQLTMFRAIILPIFRSSRLCITACGIIHPRCCRPAASWVHYTTSCNTQSSAPEDGQNNCPKHVELTGIINKPLLLHLVGCLYYLLTPWSRVLLEKLTSNAASQEIPRIYGTRKFLTVPTSSRHPSLF